MPEWIGLLVHIVCGGIVLKWLFSTNPYSGISSFLGKDIPNLKSLKLVLKVQMLLEPLQAVAALFVFFNVEFWWLLIVMFLLKNLTALILMKQFAKAGLIMRQKKNSLLELPYSEY